jgi:hypothetical protein
VLLHDLVGRFPRLSHLFAESADAGPLPVWINTYLRWDSDMVAKPQARRGFQVLPQGWNIERTPGWLIRDQRLARDDEGLPSSSEALIQIASIRLFLTHLTLPCSISLEFRHTLSQTLSLHESDREEPRECRKQATPALRTRTLLARRPVGPGICPCLPIPRYSQHAYPIARKFTRIHGPSSPIFTAHLRP